MSVVSDGKEYGERTGGKISLMEVDDRITDAKMFLLFYRRSSI